MSIFKKDEILTRSSQDFDKREDKSFERTMVHFEGMLREGKNMSILSDTNLKSREMKSDFCYSKTLISF